MQLDQKISHNFGFNCQLIILTAMLLQLRALTPLVYYQFWRQSTKHLHLFCVHVCEVTILILHYLLQLKYSKRPFYCPHSSGSSNPADSIDILMPCKLIWTYGGAVYLQTDEGNFFLILCWSISIIFFPLTGTTEYEVLWTIVSNMLLKFQVLGFHLNIASNYFFLITLSQRYFLQEKNQEKLYYFSWKKKKTIKKPP